MYNEYFMILINKIIMSKLFSDTLSKLYAHVEQSTLGKRVVQSKHTSILLRLNLGLVNSL